MNVPRVADVFCCLGTTIKHARSEEAFRRVDFTYVHELARLASRHRAGQFLLVSALGADRQSRLGEAEEAVRKLPAREPRGTGTRVQLFVGPLGRYRPIAARVVAAAMVHTAKDATRGVHVYESDRIRGARGMRMSQAHGYALVAGAQVSASVFLMLSARAMPVVRLPAVDGIPRGHRNNVPDKRR